MTNKENDGNQAASYKSFEQWRAELFPDLIDEERKNSINLDEKELAVTLANESFHRLLKSRSNR
ncbi:MAG: hypothetical protein GY862_15370 [Gammaproteobacteria bacterium]|nr:hypothetical protein [Gammaproteobacteria bacterium]